MASDVYLAGLARELAKHAERWGRERDSANNAQIWRIITEICSEVRTEQAAPPPIAGGPG